jgi:hypothetical protein
MYDTIIEIVKKIRELLPDDYRERILREPLLNLPYKYIK